MDRRAIAAVVAPFLCLAALNAHAQGGAGVGVDPALVKIGFFYGGRKVTVRADMPFFDDAVILVTGQRKDLTLQKKGKRAGVLWMNVGEVEYKDVPAIFIIRSSRPLDKIASPEELKRLGLGYDALEDQVTTGADQHARDLYPELIKLKEKEKLFSVRDDGVPVGPIVSPRLDLAYFFLPPKAPRGEYQVKVFAFNDGKGVLAGEGELTLQFSSGVQFIYDMAKNRGLLYGVLAAAIAIVAGLATGFIFGGKGETH
ncbi:MAG TPA: TIGR02186 family protein [bacterium]|nr:TIGR02186 family protein [bacterium]